ncbi:hypothetical protein BDCR2A_00226 [Borrelia duttonii CR2A]|uniref:Uncharacterized protein n=1 Tax=Borrelia duttonii CR2A TaxID=1432657 RepID=W6TIB0_9SPIR|nr:hypothetical protein BDCR2A_00226 [Borrelia duttonii CR2A]
MHRFNKILTIPLIMYIAGVNIIVNVLIKIEVYKTILSLFRIAICLGNISEQMSTIIVMMPVENARELLPYLSRTNFVVRVLAVILAILFFFFLGFVINCILLFLIFLFLYVLKLDEA